MTNNKQDENDEAAQFFKKETDDRIIAALINMRKVQQEALIKIMTHIEKDLEENGSPASAIQETNSSAESFSLLKTLRRKSLTKNKPNKP